jgi:hypothetical protein
MGLAKILDNNNNARCYTFVGTPVWDYFIK